MTFKDISSFEEWEKQWHASAQLVTCCKDFYFLYFWIKLETTGTASTFIVSEGILNSQFSSIFLWLEDENFAMVLCTRQNVFGFIGTVAIYSCPISHDETLRIQNTVQKWERVLLQTKKNIMFNACFCSWLYLFFFFLTPLLYLYQRINQANIEIKIENFFLLQWN